MLPLKILKLLKKRARRFPEVYDLELLGEILMNSLVKAKKSFLANRSERDLEHIICVHYHLCKKIKLNEENTKQRHLGLRLFRFSNADGTQGLSIAIVISPILAHELFEEKHIYRALVSLIPGIEIIPESFYSFSNKDSQSLFCYLEITKPRGTNLTSKDIDLLKRKLPLELKQGIQTLTFSLLFSYNEETVYKNAIQLSRELKTENDIPQVIIFFQDHIQDVLNFSVIIVKARKKNEPPFAKNLLLPSSAQMSIQKVIPLGNLDSGYTKEAIILSLEIEHSLFLRKNWSIDINQARNYVVKIIEQFLGVFRDYNGGLLSKQNEQLEQIKKDLRVKYESFSPLMQELFHSFNPPSFQALISTNTAKRLFSFFVSFLKREVKKDEILIEDKKNGNSLFVLAKSSSLKQHQLLLEEIKSFQKEVLSSVGFSGLEFENQYFICFVDLNSSLQIDVKVHLEKALERKNGSKEQIKEQKILRLNFQEGDPLSLNPQIAIDQRCRCLGKGLFEGLTRLNFKGIPEPAAAKEIRISACQTIYTFILRKHYWSNGEEVSAYDFEQAWKNAITPDSNCLRSDLFYIIKNARLAHHGLKSLDEVKVKAQNAKTLVIELEYPAFYFLHLLSHPIFSPIYKGEQEPNYFNGPFLLKEWKRHNFLHLTSNPYYWDKKNVQLKDITIHMHKEGNSIGKMFEKKELDWFGEPFNSSSAAVALKENKSWKKKKVDQFYWIYLNTQSFPLTSANIRKALACAINRKNLTKVFKGKPHYINSLLLSPSNKKIKWDGNIDLAKKFFNEGLKDLNISQGAFPEINLYWSFSGEENLIRMIQEQIESALGIKVVFKRIAWNHLSALLDKREYQISTCYRSSPYFYPRSYLELFRESSNLYNTSQWENSKYKELIDKAHRSLQAEEREQFLIEAEQILLNEMPVIPLFLPEYSYLVSPKIKKYAISSNGDIDLKCISTQMSTKY